MRGAIHRRGVVAAALCAVAALGVATVSGRDWLIFNHSASIPSGFYVRTNDAVVTGALVTVRARDVAPQQAHQRQFEDMTDRFIKRVAATAGATVCGDGRTLSVNGEPRAEALEAAALALGWSGCSVLGPGEVLLLGDSADSFDGRYWGPTDVSLVEGVWRKL